MRAASLPASATVVARPGRLCITRFDSKASRLIRSAGVLPENRLWPIPRQDPDCTTTQNRDIVDFKCHFHFLKGNNCAMLRSYVIRKGAYPVHMVLGLHGTGGSHGCLFCITLVHKAILELNELNQPLSFPDKCRYKRYRQ